MPTEERPARRAAQWREKKYRRRAEYRRGDVTAVIERLLREKTKSCRMCRRRLSDEPNRPNSKHLDHVVPLCVGGTHTIGNVRIVCAECNASRPKDGSDVVGQLSFDSGLEEAILLLSAAPKCDCGTDLVRGRCRVCNPVRTHEMSRRRGQQALLLRLQGCSWQAIAEQLEYATEGGAWLAADACARRHGSTLVRVLANPPAWLIAEAV